VTCVRSETAGQDSAASGHRLGIRIGNRLPHGRGSETRWQIVGQCDGMPRIARHNMSPAKRVFIETPRGDENLEPTPEPSPSRSRLGNTLAGLWPVRRRAANCATQYVSRKTRLHQNTKWRRKSGTDPETDSRNRSLTVAALKRGGNRLPHGRGSETRSCAAAGTWRSGLPCQPETLRNASAGSPVTHRANGP
jgi:hypothetical protein